MQKIKIFTLINTFPITQEEVDNEVNQYIAMIHSDGHKVININVDIKYLDDSCTWVYHFIITYSESASKRSRARDRDKAIDDAINENKNGLFKAYVC